MIQNASARKCLFISLMLFLSTFGMTLSAFAAIKVVWWPSCGAKCTQYGPGGSNDNPDSCHQCCGDPANSCASTGDAKAYATCIICCDAHNDGNPNGPVHCAGAGKGSLTTPPVAVPID